MGYHQGMKVRLGHAADADDAFFSYALAAGKVPSRPYEFEHVTEDIQKLNDLAARGELEVTPISVHAYAYAREKYLLGRCGAVFADRRGPMIVSRDELSGQALGSSGLAVPGTTSSAYLALHLYNPGLRTMVLPGDKIIPAVKTGLVPCALLVEEAPAACSQLGLHCLANLGQWWASKNDGDPLPLRCLAFRKDLPPATRSALEHLLTESIRYALDHKAEATAYAARQVGSGDAAETAARLNAGDRSLDMGDRGRQSIEKFLSLGHQAGLIPDALPLEFV
jgi:1,4-dihydroxy-6-naphthoate synthase